MIPSVRGRSTRPQAPRSVAAWRLSLAVLFAFLGLLALQGPMAPQANAQTALGYAEEVVSFTPGTYATPDCVPNNQGGTASGALGPPGGGAASLGTGGILVLRMSTPFGGSGDASDDIYVAEGGIGLDENYTLEVSADGTNWTLVGTVPNGASNTSTGFDIDAAGFDEFDQLFYVRITDLPPTASFCSPTVGENSGVDIESVWVLSRPVYADIEIDKTSDVTDPATLVVGDEITYSFLVTNTGTVDLTDVTVTDPLPGLSATDPVSADLAAGDSATFTATYTVTQADVDNGQITNTATATGDPPEECTQCTTPTDEDTEVVPLTQTPGISIEKTADPMDGLVVGDTVTYTFVATNTGNVTLSNVTITDNHVGLSAITPASVASLAPGATAEFTATYVVTQADVDAGEIVNSATATGEVPETCTQCTDPVSDPDSVTIVIPPAPAVTVDKSADPTSGVNEGDTITYTFVATNTGNITVTNVTIDDPLPGLTWVNGPNLGTIAPGESATGSATYVVTAEDVVAGQIVNSAIATCEEGCDPPPCLPGDPCSVIVDVGDPGLAIDKTADPMNGVEEGDTITYSFTATNTGEVTLHNVTLVDNLPGLTWVTGPALGDLEPGEVANGSATYVVTAEDVAAGEIRNSATATCDFGCDPDPKEVIVIVGQPNVVIAKTADTAGPVNAGDVITYTFTATNSGDATATNVVITDQLAGLTWVTGPELGDIAAGGSAEGSATYTVTEADVVAGGVTNAATITCDRGCDPTPSEVFVPTGPDPGPGALTVDKTSDVSGEVHPGDLVTYTFTVTNTGGSSVENVTVTDPLPGLSAIEGPHGTTLAPGESAVFTATYPVTEQDADNGFISNTATATGTDVTGTSVSDDDTVNLEACSLPGTVPPSPTPGPGTPEADDLELDEESQFEGAATCSGVVIPNPTDPPVDPQPTRPSGGNNGGGGGGGPITQLPSTGQADAGNPAFTTILPLGALVLLGLAMTIAFAQRRNGSRRQD